MIKLRFKDLRDINEGHVLKDFLKDDYLNRGEMRYGKPGFITHFENNVHTHEDNEAYFFFQGKGLFEVGNKEYNVKTGDIIIIEPGENHHLIIDKDDPCIYLWIHAGNERHKNQILPKSSS